MKYEWDESKNRSNQKKHGYPFELAPMVFEGVHLSSHDCRRNYGEERFIAIGTLGLYGREVVVAYTARANNIRIISLLRANDRERARFYKILGALI